MQLDQGILQSRVWHALLTALLQWAKTCYLPLEMEFGWNVCWLYLVAGVTDF